MKSIKEIINESKQTKYSVAFNDCKDSEGLPISIEIIVDSQYKDIFEKFLKDEEGNIFAHACGKDFDLDFQY